MNLTYGLETASLGLMLRMGKVLAKGADPAQIVRDTFEAGVDCCLNFMFGFPTETDQDFEATLDFLRANSPWIRSVNPCPQFTAVFEGTYLHEHPDEFGMDLTGSARYWTSKDGANTYPSRMARFERFLDVAYSLGIPCNYPSRTFLFKDAALGHYYYSRGEFELAKAHLERAVDANVADTEAASRLQDCRSRIKSIKQLSNISLTTPEGQR